MDRASQPDVRDAARRAFTGHDHRRSPYDAADPSTRESLPEAEVLIHCAVSLEANALIARLENRVTIGCAHFTEYCGSLGQRPVVILVSGGGVENTRLSVLDSVAVYQPQWVVGAGFATALREELRRGHILMAADVTNEEGQSYQTGLQVDPQSLEQTPGVSQGSLVSVSQASRTPADKLELAQRFAAEAFDLEGYSLAEACEEKAVRCLLIRVINEKRDDKIPDDLLRMVKQESWAAKLGAATGALVRRPGGVKDLWKMRDESVKCAERLASFVVSMLDQIP